MNIGYVSVHTGGPSAHLQEEALKSHGCTKTVIDTLEDVESDRPELCRLLKHMKEGDELAVWSLDRLAGSFAKLRKVLDVLKKNNVKFRSLGENVCFGNAEEACVAIKAMDAAMVFQYDLGRYKTMVGIAKAKKHGKKVGRKHALKDKDIKRALVMLEHGGMSRADVAAELGVSYNTLSSSIKRVLLRESADVTSGSGSSLLPEELGVSQSEGAGGDLVEAIWRYLIKYYSGDVASCISWLNCEREDLGGKAPIEAIEDRPGEVLACLIAEK
ncbi:recombinase family protein [Halomonas organivorans]